jgi:hypothetical protein
VGALEVVLESGDREGADRAVVAGVARLPDAITTLGIHGGSQSL